MPHAHPATPMPPGPAPDREDDARGDDRWCALRTRWPALPRRERRARLRAGALLLSARWARGADLSLLPADDLLLPLPDTAGAAAEPDVAAPHPAVTPPALVQALAAWMPDVEEILLPSEARFFVQELAGAAGSARDTARLLASEAVRTAREQGRFRSGQRFLHELRYRNPAAGSPPHTPLSGFWHPDPHLGLDELARAVESAGSAAEAHVLKPAGRPGAPPRVLRVPLLGTDAVIKRYELTGRLRRLRYLWRLSHGRRAYAAARALLGAGLPTPRPLGFLEVRRGGLLLRSYYLCAFEERTATLRAWAEQHPTAADAPARRRVAAAVRRLLVRLRRSGIYHADTKATNLLLRERGDRDADLLLIDLECVRCGVRPGRGRLVRNLVQLNGSVAHAVPRDERCEFLARMARHEPALLRASVVKRIERWTRRRLAREERLSCGP